MTLPPPIPLEQAQARFLAMTGPLGSEQLPVSAAVGRYLAEPLRAMRSQPAADLSAMDGYAMRADDRAGPWRIVGESAAGHPHGGELTRGEAVRISTGALLPPNAGAILLQEEAQRESADLAVSQGGEATPRHIRRAGFDFAEATQVLEAGTLIGPGQIALALSAGHASLPVHRLPRIAVLDSGDELASEPGRCAPHQIPASNGAMLAAMAGPLAHSIRRIGPVADRMDALASALGEAEDADVLVTSGGASVGDHDLIRPALEAWGARIDFWRVAMKPGKPLLVARRGEQVVLGLPGNPVSSYVTAFLFLLPLLRRMAGAHCPGPASVSLPLAGPLPATGERREFVRATLSGGCARPFQQQDSSALATLAAANLLIDRACHSPAAAAGDMVSAYLLGNGGIA